MVKHNMFFSRSCLVSLMLVITLTAFAGCQKYQTGVHTETRGPAPSLDEYLGRNFNREAPLTQQELEQKKVLFVQKCSACHDPNRAFGVVKDPEVWAQTIKRMQYYSKGAISDQDAQELIDFHVNEQQKEIDTFNDTCTKCHNDDRISSKSMSEEQWLATIKRMQLKAPELISDEKINLLAAYFHRRELTMARIFSGKCGLCHQDGLVNQDSTQQMNILILLANEEFGNSMRVADARNLQSSHIQRQEREMQIYENNCSTCHPDNLSEKKQSGSAASSRNRTRAEWISFIAQLQGAELTKELQVTINSQIEFHRSQY